MSSARYGCSRLLHAGSRMPIPPRRQDSARRARGRGGARASVPLSVVRPGGSGPPGPPALADARRQQDDALHHTSEPEQGVPPCARVKPAAAAAPRRRWHAHERAVERVAQRQRDRHHPYHAVTIQGVIHRSQQPERSEGCRRASTGKERRASRNWAASQRRKGAGRASSAENMAAMDQRGGAAGRDGPCTSRFPARGSTAAGGSSCAARRRRATPDPAAEVGGRAQRTQPPGQPAGDGRDCRQGGGPARMRRSRPEAMTADEAAPPKASQTRESGGDDHGRQRRR